MTELESAVALLEADINAKWATQDWLAHWRALRLVLDVLKGAH